MTDSVAALAPKPRGSIIMAMIWMMLLSLLLFWIPPFGSLIAGVVGGKTAGGAWRGLTAALLPSVVLALAMAALAGTLAGIPLLGILVGLGTGVFLVIQIAPLLLGALIGGLLA